MRRSVAWMTCVTRRIPPGPGARGRDRKSTRLNSSHLVISYAVFCLKKKKVKPVTCGPIDLALAPAGDAVQLSLFAPCIRLSLNLCDQLLCRSSLCSDATYAL